MSSCSELTIYKVLKENIPKVIELSLSIINEMNENETVITAHKIGKKIDNNEELCWRLTWVNEQAYQLYTVKWPDLPSCNELMSLVETKIYHGLFVDIV